MEKQQTSNEYGMSQELFFLSELVNYGIVSIPYGNSGRYDCILDIQGDLYKIQIKSVNQIDEFRLVIPFANTRMSANGSVKKEYTPDEVDFIGIIYNYQLYLFPTTLATKSLTVRISKNDGCANTTSKLHYLEDFEIHKILDIDLHTWVALKEETRQTNGENYLIPRFSCKNCGSPVSTKDALCISCARIASRKVERPNRLELKNLIRSTSFTQIAKQYGVTDNAVRKWCKVENLPFRVRDIKNYSDAEWEEI